MRHHSFSEVPQFESFEDVAPKNDLEKKKTCFIADEKSHGLGTQTRNIMQNKWPISNDFGLRNRPSFRKKNRQKKSYTSIEGFVFRAARRASGSASVYPTFWGLFWFTPFSQCSRGRHSVTRDFLFGHFSRVPPGSRLRWGVIFTAPGLSFSSLAH